MRRTVQGFEIEWIGSDRIEVVRSTEPKHRYEFVTSPDRKRVKRLHLAHHFHSERGNFGIMSFIPDRLFGTLYNAVRDMPRSPTTFNLGYDRAEAARYPFVAELTGAPPRDRPPLAGEGEVGHTAATELLMPRKRAAK